MKQDWADYEKAADKGPLPVLAKAFVAIMFVATVASVTGYVFGWFGSAAAVAKEEFGPRAMLDKYTWFKDAAAQLEKKLADAEVYDARIKAMINGYGETPRTKWAREDREQMNVWTSEVAGVKASFNQLAAEYNAKMAEIHWRFANRGDLPQGAADPLPREFKRYEEK
jgi:hypothetical protein